jgi:hypothetical protein
MKVRTIQEIEAERAAIRLQQRQTFERLQLANSEFVKSLTTVRFTEEQLAEMEAHRLRDQAKRDERLGLTLEEGQAIRIKKAQDVAKRRVLSPEERRVRRNESLKRYYDKRHAQLKAEQIVIERPFVEPVVEPIITPEAALAAKRERNKLAVQRWKTRHPEEAKRRSNEYNKVYRIRALRKQAGLIAPIAAE